MSMDRNQVIEIIKAKDLHNDLSPDFISLALDEVEQVVLNYCMIPEVPNALRFTVANMTLDLLKYQLEVNKPTDTLNLENIDISDVSGVKVGDTSVDIGESRRDNVRKSVLNSHKNNLDDIVMNYRSQLNRFRRLW